MKILLFGVSNVGKSATGKLLAERIGYKYYDLDDEIKKKHQMLLEEFVHTRNLRWRDQQRGVVIKKVLSKDENMVFAITPISYSHNFRNRILEKDVLAIELVDTPENIFDRLVFSDENDNIYTDDEYKNLHRDYYLSEIEEDIKWYGKVNSEIGIKHKFIMKNDSTERVVERLIAEYHLDAL